MDVGEPENIAVQPIGIIAAAKGRKKCISIGEYILLTRVFEIMKIACLDIIKWVTIYGSIV
jgi:hypothetical protein